MANNQAIAELASNSATVRRLLDEQGIEYTTTHFAPCGAAPYDEFLTHWTAQGIKWIYCERVGANHAPSVTFTHVGLTTPEKAVAFSVGHPIISEVSG